MRLRDAAILFFFAMLGVATADFILYLLGVFP